MFFHFYLLLSFNRCIYFPFSEKNTFKKWGTVECFSPDLTDEDLIQKFTFGFVPLVSLRPFPVFKNGFLTATLTPRPFLTRLQWAVDGSTEGSDPSLRSCVILAGLQGHDLQTIMDAICCAFFRLVFHLSCLLIFLRIYCTSHQDKPGFFANRLVGVIWVFEKMHNFLNL